MYILSYCLADVNYHGELSMKNKSVVSIRISLFRAEIILSTRGKLSSMVFTCGISHEAGPSKATYPFSHRYS